MNKQQNWDAERSRSAFVFAKALIEREFGARLVSLENHRSEFERWLDQQLCVDGLLISRGGVIPINWRCRFDSEEKAAQRAFTVRRSKKSGAKTEWQKLLTADVMPMFAFSIYIDEELPSYSIAYIEVGNLVAFIQSCAAKIKRDKHGDTFFSCAWSELDRLGYLKYINANF